MFYINFLNCHLEAEDAAGKNAKLYNYDHPYTGVVVTEEQWRQADSLFESSKKSYRAAYPVALVNFKHDCDFPIAVKYIVKKYGADALNA